MKTVLCFGDSNTWGYDPEASFGQPFPVRFAHDVRWTGVLARELGTGWRVIEEGQNGRTTVFDDPLVPSRRGLDYLPAAIESHKPLDAEVRAGRLREDLAYQLNVLPLSVPPLRERGDDVALLAHHYFDKFSAERGRRLKGFSRRAMQAMAAHGWPGNVRELVNRIRRAMVLAEGRLIDPVDLGLEQTPEKLIRMPLDEARLNAERDAIAECLQSAGKNVSHAAKQLRISRMTLYRLMAKHRISA